MGERSDAVSKLLKRANAPRCSSYRGVSSSVAYTFRILVMTAARGTRILISGVAFNTSPKHNPRRELSDDEVSH